MRVISEEIFFVSIFKMYLETAFFKTTALSPRSQRFKLRKKTSVKSIQNLPSKKICKMCDISFKPECMKSLWETHLLTPQEAHSWILASELSTVDFAAKHKDSQISVHPSVDKSVPLDVSLGDSLSKNLKKIQHL